MNIRDVLDWMGVLGIPSIFAIAVFCGVRCIKHAKMISILMKAQQAQMRTKLLELYDVYMKRGWITQVELDDYDNQYQSYHALGRNGVMDDRYKQVLSLPIKNI